MVASESLKIFLKGIREDGRMGPSHISLYLAILQYAEEHSAQNPICAFSWELMPLAKISGAATYRKGLRQLHEAGYIRYLPSYNHFLGSLIFII